MKFLKEVLRSYLILLLVAGSGLCSAQDQDAKTQSQYLFRTFKKGIVEMTSGLPLESIMNYNCLTEEMIFIQDGRRLALTNLATIDTVFIDDRIFVPVGEVFYEIAVDGDADLFIQHKAKASFEGEQVGYGGTSQLSNVKSVSSLREEGQFFYMDMPENIVVKPDPIIWVRYNDEMVTIYSKRTTLKAFPGLESSLKQYFKSNKTDFEDISDLVRLVVHINSLDKN